MPAEVDSKPIVALAPELVEVARAFDTEMDHQGLTMAQMRESYRTRVLAEGSPDDPVSTRDLSIATRHGAVAVRLYSPPAAGPVALLVYMHGGGFVVGDLDCLDVPLHRLCRKSGVAILAVDYGLAPEAKFPVAVEQCEDVLRYATTHRTDLGVNDRLGVAGDSAGGNLSALLAQRLRKDAQVELHWQCLINPVLDIRGVVEERTASMRTFRNGPILKRDVMLWFNEMYHQRPEDQIASSPARVTELRGLPPAFVVTAECDALRDEAADYADCMRAAGVNVDYRSYAGMFHNFILYTHRSPTAAGMVDDVARMARQRLGAARGPIERLP